MCVSFVVKMPAVHSRPYQPPDRMLGGHIDNCWLWYVLNRQHRREIERLGLEPFVYVTNLYEWGEYKIGRGQNPIRFPLIPGWIVLFTPALWHCVLRLEGANNTRISVTYRCWGWSFDVPGAIDLCPGHRVELGVDLVPEMGIQVFRVEDGFIVAVPPCRHQRHTHMEREVDMAVALLPRTPRTPAHRIASQWGNIFDYESETVHEYCTPPPQIWESVQHSIAWMPAPLYVVQAIYNVYWGANRVHGRVIPAPRPRTATAARRERAKRQKEKKHHNE